jgi:hypothetical protein
MPALFALALCDACSQPQAQAPAQATVVPATPASVGDARGAAAASDERDMPASANNSSNRQPRTNAR